MSQRKSKARGQADTTQDGRTADAAADSSTAAALSYSDAAHSAASAAADSPSALVAASAAPAVPVDPSDPHNLRSWSAWSLFGCLALLTLSGTLKTLTTQLASDHPAKLSASLLIGINYLGQWGFGWASGTRADKKRGDAAETEPTAQLDAAGSLAAAQATAQRARSTHHLLVLIAALDVVGCAFCLAATVLIGSGLYQVLYASILVMIALLSTVLLGYKQTPRQWGCLVVVTGGLWASSAAATAQKASILASSSGSGGGLSQPSSSQPGLSFHCEDYFPSNPWLSPCAHLSPHVLGILLTLLGTWIYALQSVLCELLHTSPTRLRYVSAGEINTMIGRYGLGMSAGVMGAAAAWRGDFYSAQDWNPSRWVSGVPFSDALHIGGVLGVYLLANVFHRAVYWGVVERTGSIFAGLANALRTVAVFLLSAACFCSTQPMQCLTVEKSAAALMVVVGVGAYQMCPKGKQQRTQPPMTTTATAGRAKTA